MAQEKQDGSFVYVHNLRESLTSKVVKSVLWLAGKNRSIERDMTRGKIRQRAASVPFFVSRMCHTEVEQVAGRRVWTLHPKRKSSSRVILYLHGGAYIYNILSLHWYLIGQLIKGTGATMVVPDYPLAPRHSCTDTHAFMDQVYRQLLERYPAGEILFMGDSAGAGLALAFSQQLRDRGQPLPGKLMLLSPWLDVGMTHPGLAAIERYDRLLNIRGPRLAGASYAGDLDIRDSRVSPLFGALTGLPEISIFTSTHDIAHVDSLELRGRLQSEGISSTYYEYPRMLHDWFIFPGLPEARHCIRQICAAI
jgi:acetyl esterase/lipase